MGVVVVSRVLPVSVIGPLCLLRDWVYNLRPRASEQKAARHP